MQDFNFSWIFREADGAPSMRRVLAALFGLITAALLLVMSLAPAGALAFVPTIIAASLTLGLLFATTLGDLFTALVAKVKGTGTDKATK